MWRTLLALTWTLIAAAAWAVDWTTPDAIPAGDTRPWFVFSVRNASTSAAFEREVLAQPVVQEFLADFLCVRGTEGTATDPDAPFVLSIQTPVGERWRAEQAVTARELITALVIHGTASSGGTPPPATGAAAPAPAATSDALAGPPVATDPSGDAANPALDLTQAVVARDGADLQIQAQVLGTAQVDGFHLYLDTDGSQSTGYNTTNILGADMMVEGASIYRFGGATQTDWNWGSALGAATYSFTGSVLSLSAPLATLGLTTGQQVPVSFGTTGSDWAPQDWMPDGAPVTLTVP